MPFIIDGHNLLWTVAKGGEEFEPVSDVRLCHIISRYLKQIAEKGEMVFDGTGPHDKGGFENISNLEVTFAGASSDCDTVIEHKIDLSTAPRHLTIVSSDRRLRRAARARRATAVKSEEFWAEVQKELAQRRAVSEPPGKRQGITEGETEKWMEMFGLEQ